MATPAQESKPIEEITTAAAIEVQVQGGAAATALRPVEGTFKTAEGHALFYRGAFPAQHVHVRGVVVFLHGINDHSGLYTRVIDEFGAKGFAMLAYDLRGHGQSYKDVDGLTGHVRDFRTLYDDTNRFVDVVKSEILPKMDVAPEGATSPPLILMGMSLGTLISVHTLLSERHVFGGVILIAPAVSVEWTPVLRVMGFLSSILAALLPKKRLVPGVNDDFICRDPAYIPRYDADPLTTREPITCRMAHETLKSMKALQRDRRVEDATSKFCALPLLMMMGSEDRVTSVPLARRFFDRLANPDKEFIQIDGAYHVLFEDFDREKVMDQLFGWLDKRFPVGDASTA